MGSEQQKGEKNQQDFVTFELIQDTLGLKNPIKKNISNSTTKNGDEEEKIPLSEIAKDYVFTVDNFIKMCLILIRLRARIPVIMMGETGCGKTSLIKKLSERCDYGN